jgi:hypothetical protein
MRCIHVLDSLSDDVPGLPEWYSGRHTHTARPFRALHPLVETQWKNFGIPCVKNDALVVVMEFHLNIVFYSSVVFSIPIYFFSSF